MFRSLSLTPTTPTTPLRCRALPSRARRPPSAPVASPLQSHPIAAPTPFCRRHHDANASSLTGRALPILSATSDDVPAVAVEGDTVRVRYVCCDEAGEVLEASDEVDAEGISFEIGAGDVVGNPFYQGFDAAVRGLAVGQTVELEASGGEWSQELVFKVPIDHEEMVRLANRYKNQGGLREGAILELSNGGKALILKVDEQEVLLDANNMLAGKKLFFNIELLAIDKFN